MNKRESGSLGGKKTVEKYGISYMAELARRGGQAMHAKYEMRPINQNDFAFIERATGRVNQKTLNGMAIEPGEVAR